MRHLSPGKVRADTRGDTKHWLRAYAHQTAHLARLMTESSVLVTVVPVPTSMTSEGAKYRLSPKTPSNLAPAEGKELDSPDCSTEIPH